MKADGKYRFNLQFPADTEEQVQAGELLERVGYRKSAIVVEAINLYLTEHPDVLDSESKIEIHSTHRYSQDEILQMIRKVMKEFLSSEHDAGDKLPTVQSEHDMEDDISQMLDNLDLFSIKE